MNLAIRPLWGLVLLVLAFALGMASMLGYFKYESTLKNLRRSALSLVAADVVDAIQRSIELSGQLQESPTLQALIERQFGASPLIVGIDILDEKGRILFSTEAQRRLTMAPAPWIKAAGVSAGGGWSVTENRTFVTGRIVTNSFGVALGGVAIRHDRAGFDHSLAQMRLYLAAVGWAVLGAAGVFATLALLGLGGLMRRDFALAARAFTGDTPTPSRRHAALEREMLAGRAGIEGAERAVTEVVSAMAASAITLPARSVP